jgi:hypothetical protein
MNTDTQHAAERARKTPGLNAELLAIFEADQNDRKSGAEMDSGVTERDAARRSRVAEIIAVGALQSADDYLHAAFIFQHGDQIDDYWKAHELALKAVELGCSEEKKARWMAAASYDRWLIAKGKPQKFGTQFLGDKIGWRLLDYDPVTTDAERAEWGVPPLATSLHRVDDLNKRHEAQRLAADSEGDRTP